MTLTATVCMCIACHGHMQNLDEEGNQPKDGLEFISYGHYGSTVFDPMNGSYLVINLCDDCLKKASAKGWVYQAKKRKNVYDRVTYETFKNERK